MTAEKVSLPQRVLETIVIMGTGGIVLALMTLAVNTAWTKLGDFDDLKTEVLAITDEFDKEVKEFRRLANQRGDLIIVLSGQITDLENRLSEVASSHEGEESYIKAEAEAAYEEVRETIQMQQAEQMAAPSPKAAIRANVKTRKGN